jgi:cysteine desulfurase/selenocysteine lyase
LPAEREENFMATTVAPVRTDWRKEWFEIEDAAYLNTAGQSALPKVALRAAQNALEWKKFPHRMPDAAYFEIPNRIRASIAQLIGAKAEEIALTTGASTGMAAVAHGLAWQPGDEIVTAAGEFPMQFATWKPMEEREGVALKIVKPRERFLSANDLIAALTPRTRLVSVSMVRFDDAALLDAANVGAACHAQGALLLLDVSQCCGATPFDVTTIGADFITCAGYKWLLGPYGTGFFWTTLEMAKTLRPAPFYWQAIAGAENGHFGSLNFADPKPTAGSRRWDSAETASYFNLAALDASLKLISEIGVAAVAEHNRGLIELMYARLPKDRCVAASPPDAAQRGPYGCFAARTPEKTAELYAQLSNENIVVSLREGNIRVSPYVFNTERDIDRLISVVTA